MGGRRGQGPQPLAGPSQRSGGSIGITRESCSWEKSKPLTAGAPGAEGRDATPRPDSRDKETQE